MTYKLLEQRITALDLACSFLDNDNESQAVLVELMDELIDTLDNKENQTISDVSIFHPRRTTPTP